MFLIIVLCQVKQSMRCGLKKLELGYLKVFGVYWPKQIWKLGCPKNFGEKGCKKIGSRLAEKNF